MTNTLSARTKLLQRGLEIARRAFQRRRPTEETIVELKALFVATRNNDEASGDNNRSSK